MLTDKFFLSTTLIILYAFSRDYLHLRHNPPPGAKNLKKYQIFWHALASNIFLYGIYFALKPLVFDHLLIKIESWTNIYYGISLFITETITNRLTSRVKLKPEEYMSLEGVGLRAITLFAIFFCIGFLPLLVINTFSVKTP